MLGAVLRLIRAKREERLETHLVQRMVSQVAGYDRIAALVYPTTQYFSDPHVLSRVARLKSTLGDRLYCVASADSSWAPETFAAMRVIQLADMEREGVDCAVIPSTQFAEVIYYLCNASTVNNLPVVAPALAGVPHRLFLRRELLSVLATVPEPRVLEIGSIEHPLGGHRTTQALSEALWGRGDMTTIDINPLSLKLAEYYCAHTPTSVHYLEGDCREVIRGLDQRPLDFVLLHFMSDSTEASPPLIQAFDLIEPRLTREAPVVFQSTITGDPLPGTLQSYLRSRGFDTKSTPIEGASNPLRFFIVARRPL